jgi:hypothetical protein
LGWPSEVAAEFAEFGAKALGIGAVSDQGRDADGGQNVPDVEFIDVPGSSPERCRDLPRIAHARTEGIEHEPSSPIVTRSVQ